MIETRHRVRATDVGRGLVGLAPELPAVARNVTDLMFRTPSSKKSIGSIFQRLAAKYPQRPFVVAHNGKLTYDEANREVNRIANVLQDAGVQPGDAVGLMSHNTIDMLLAMLATVKLGAISGLFNYHQRGDVLAHSIAVMQPKIVLVEDALLEEFATAGPLADGVQLLPISALKEQAHALPVVAERNPEETARIPSHAKAYYIFTSGTTGMPKASIMSHHRWLQSYTGLGGLGVRLKEGDTLYCCLPMYHNNAVTVALGAVLNGGACLAISRKFSVSNFWADVERYDASAFVYIGELCRYLLGQPVREQERQHRVRVIVGNGLRQDIWKDFQQRFGIERVAEFYGASECNIAFINAYGIDETAGTTILPHRVVQFDPETGQAKRNAKGRLVQVKPGETGLLLAKVTKKQPFDGYTDSGASEQKLLRNGFRRGDCWFVTGDLVRRQGLHHVAFVDRLGDTFRWKGENVATTEVEAALERIDFIEDSTVYGVAVPGTDGKAGMGAIVLAAGEQFDPVRAASELRDALPPYALPLFLRVVASLEHTSTFKSRKVELRDAAFTDVGRDPVWVLTRDGYQPLYPEYCQDVASARQP